MSKTAETENRYLVAGEQVHFLEAITLHTSENGLGGGAMAVRGTTLTLTEAMLRLNGFLRLVGDEDAQLQRWGRVIVRPGRWPEGTLTTRPGERLHEEHREEARQRAWAEEQPEARRAALAAVEATYGRQVTSTEVASYRGGSR